MLVSHTRVIRPVITQVPYKTDHGVVQPLSAYTHSDLSGMRRGALTAHHSHTKLALIFTCSRACYGVLSVLYEI